MSGMDGSTQVLGMDGRVVQAGPKHRKFVVRVKWSPCGSFFATASYDGTAELWGLTAPARPAKGSCEAEKEEKEETREQQGVAAQ
mgnify:CR=1 FL=1